MSALRFTEGYIKPKEMRQLSGNARKRESIRALGSITCLQRYYASGGVICEGMPDDYLSKISFVDLLSPRSGLMPPTTEQLLRYCHEDIQSVLEVWGIISYPSPFIHAANGQVQTPDSPLSFDENDESRQLGHGKDGSYVSLNTQQQHHYDNITIDMLTLLESSTKVISSIRTYSIHARNITPEALTIHRQAALGLVEMLSVLEQRSRIHDNEGDSTSHPEDYCYERLSYGDLEAERAEMKDYLAIAQQELLKPQAQKIETPLEQLLTADTTSGNAGVKKLPRWIRDEEWTAAEGGPSSLDRCHAFLSFFGPENRCPLPLPSSDKDGFLDALSDGYVMCMVFNAFIRLTNMPFGLVDKINEDTTRTWRAADNWRFLIQACKFRLEFKVSEDLFKPIDIVKRTALGRGQLETWVRLIVQRGIQEAQETLENKEPVTPILAPSAFPNF
ncbi:hypothetical protein BGZ99_003122 [Dissophora globulifera]|uniref:Calponin-homology (CH) domain-containing protein n=1 Tax=Dissophora globulifera TaxID=979702 RepID=A0A9P6RQW2_9FUNG|nr:hypothetical protein BGZ99_003122 [Dissophora globulifera]